MHTSAYQTGKLFFDTYCNFGYLRVVEIGSRNANLKQCLKDHKTPNVVEYIGLDFEKGDGVDHVLTNAYKYPFENNSVDVVVTSSCFEHAEMFWMSFIEAIRILKPTGLLYCNAPSSWMSYHRFPVDCWRFYPDAAKGLETWARYNNYNTMVLESFIHPPLPDEDTSDWVAVFLKDAKNKNVHKNRMIDDLVPYEGYFNGFRFPINDKFPDGWSKPSARYHQATKKRLTFTYDEIKY
jgi:hypothetical protein